MTAPHVGPGQVVAGRYSVRSVLAFSAEAATCHAVASSGHDVVLKLFDPALAQRADAMGKLAQVHQQLASLPLDLVVPIADSGFDPSTSAPFVVSELVKLPSLAALVGRGPLPPSEVVRLLEGLARALDAAHARQLPHLALKPTNVFVGPAPNGPVRIGDFGMAVVRSTSPTHEAYAKSAPWWAPEQLQPAALLGAPADVFSVALLMFYALTGRSFWGSCQATPPDLVTWQVELMAPRLTASQRASQFGVALPTALDPLFAQALSVHQAERPRLVSEFARACAVALSGVGASGYRQGQAPVPTMALPEADGYPPAPRPMAHSAPSREGMPAFGQSPPTTGAASPGLPPTPPQQSKPKSPLLPILVGVGAALVVGGVVAALLLRARASEANAPTGDPVAVAAPPPPAAPDVVPSMSASAVAPPTEPAAALPAASEAPTDAPATTRVELTLVCVPACDELLVDNEKVEKVEEKTKVLVLPGKHTVEGRKAGGYIPLKETFDVDAALDKTLRLYKAGPMPSVPQRPCVRTILKPRCP